MKNSIKTLAVWLIIGIILLFVIPAILNGGNTELTYSELLTKIEAGEVTDIEIEYGGESARVKLKNDSNIKNVNIPSVDNLMENLNASMQNNSINVVEADKSFLLIVSDLLLPISSILLLVLMAMLFLGGTGGQQKGTMTFGKSRARMLNSNDKNKVTFADVAGIDEEKEELQEIVEFLKNPRKFTDMGARIPKGVLLVGQPGTGKTLLAKAVAGEAGVPFFIISGSDFVEMFVGVGFKSKRFIRRSKEKCTMYNIYR